MQKIRTYESPMLPGTPLRIAEQIGRMDAIYANKRLTVKQGWTAETLSANWQTESGKCLTPQQINNVLGARSGKNHYRCLIDFIKKTEGPGLINGRNRRKLKKEEK